MPSVTAPNVIETFGRAVEHGDEPVNKLADTAVEVFTVSSSPRTLTA